MVTQEIFINETLRRQAQQRAQNQPLHQKLGKAGYKPKAQQDKDSTQIRAIRQQIGAAIINVGESIVPDETPKRRPQTS